MPQRKREVTSEGRETETCSEMGRKQVCLEMVGNWDRRLQMLRACVPSGVRVRGERGRAWR